MKYLFSCEKTDFITFALQNANDVYQDSRLMNGGDKKGFFSDLNGVVKDYWPGGNGVAGMCGCGLTKTCAEPDKNVRHYNSQKICQKILRIF